MPSWAKAAIDQWASSAEISSGPVFRGVNKGDRLSGESLTSQGVWRCVEKYSDVAPHDLRRTYAKLAHKGGAKLDQIQLSLGHASLTTTERYLGVHQDLHDTSPETSRSATLRDCATAASSALFLHTLIPDFEK